MGRLDCAARAEALESFHHTFSLAHGAIDFLRWVVIRDMLAVFGFEEPGEAAQELRAHLAGPVAAGAWLHDHLTTYPKPRGPISVHRMQNRSAASSHENRGHGSDRRLPVRWFISQIVSMVSNPKSRGHQRTG